jgi:hypothetical protein
MTYTYSTCVKRNLPAKGKIFGLMRFCYRQVSVHFEIRCAPYFSHSPQFAVLS